MLTPPARSSPCLNVRSGACLCAIQSEYRSPGTCQQKRDHTDKCNDAFLLAHFAYSLFFFVGQCRFYHNRAFHALFSEAHSQARRRRRSFRDNYRNWQHSHRCSKILQNSFCTFLWRKHYSILNSSTMSGRTMPSSTLPIRNFSLPTN